MSLYDDFDVKTRPTDNVSGWSSGIKLLQSQLQLKRAAVTQPKRDSVRKASLAPVIDLKSKQRDEDEVYPATSQPILKLKPSEPSIPNIPIVGCFGAEFDWNVENEYDPLWPNEYEKVVKELRESRDRESEKEEKRRERRRKSRFNDPEDEPTDLQQATIVAPPPSGFAGRWEDDEEPVSKPTRPSGGVAIAPPPSLQEPQESSPPPSKPLVSNTYDGSSVAAKIMAKYGFKEGQGLGKQEQGMSMALQVEKTSKRGGRILHEKDIVMPPPPPSTGDFGKQQEPSITEMMKSPSKVVLLKNMVGPGEVDDDLEPEVKDECNTKYGEVGSVIIHEVPDTEPEEAVRIFVEFRRIESAIKAVVDLSGRFFGGRQVKACFYDPDKYDNLQLTD